MAPRTKRSFPVEESIGFQLRQANRAVDNGLRRRLAVHDIPFGMWFYLRFLWTEDGISQATLARLVGSTPATTTVALHGMEEHGLIRRTASPTHKKIIHVFLTRYGRSLAERLLHEAAENNRDAVAGLRADDVATTLRTLHAIAMNLGPARSEPEPTP